MWQDRSFCMIAEVSIPLLIAFHKKKDIIYEYLCNIGCEMELTVQPYYVKSLLRIFNQKYCTCCK